MESSATRDSSQAASDDTGAGEETTQLTSKKFKLKPDLHDQLEERAEEHYAGNASALIRAALKDHFTTLEGENEYEVQKLQAKIADLEDQVAELAKIIDERASNQPLSQLQQMKKQSGQQPLTETQSPESSEHNGLQTETYRCIATADSSQLTLGELLEQTDSDLSGLSKAIEQLTDRGRLTSVPGTEHPTYEINSPTENND